VDSCLKSEAETAAAGDLRKTAAATMTLGGDQISDEAQDCCQHHHVDACLKTTVDRDRQYTAVAATTLVNDGSDRLTGSVRDRCRRGQQLPCLSIQAEPKVVTDSFDCDRNCGSRSSLDSCTSSDSASERRTRADGYLEEILPVPSVLDHGYDEQTTNRSDCRDLLTSLDSKHGLWTRADPHLEKIAPVSTLDCLACDEQTNASLSATQTSHVGTSDCGAKGDWFYVDRVVVGQLNAVVYVSSCLDALKELIRHLHHQQQQYQLVVLSQTPSLFPVAALQLGLVSSICYVDLDPVYRPLIGQLLSSVGVVGEGHVTYGRPRQRDVTSVLFADIVSSEGCLRQNVFELLAETRYVLTNVGYVLLVGM